MFWFFLFFSTIPLTSHQIVSFSIGSHDTYRVYLCCYSHFTTTLPPMWPLQLYLYSNFIWSEIQKISVFFGTYLSDCPTSWNSTCSFTRITFFSSIVLKKMKKEHCFLRADDCDSYLWPLMAILAVLESRGTKCKDVRRTIFLPKHELHSKLHVIHSFPRWIMTKELDYVYSFICIYYHYNVIIVKIRW